LPVADVDLGSYAYTLLEEVRLQAETEGCEAAEAFTRMVLDQFAADGLSEDTAAVHFKDGGVEVSGYGSSSDERCLDLFLTVYSPRADDEYKIGRAVADAAFRRLERFLTGCLRGWFGRRPQASELAGMCTAVQDRFSRVERVRLIVVTNARSVVREPLPATSLHGHRVSRDLWDLRRLANWAASGSQAEPIVAEFPTGLPCLQPPRSSDDHTVLLAIVSARDLADLYSTHGARLLELNVRSFLQIRTQVNRGILETLRSSPERFLAYNNGIAATASAVDVDRDPTGRTVIRRIHGLQIVNGGQTTATINHARRTRIDIDHAYVQMKLTVIPPDRLDDIVPQISAYSNTQNKVTASDLKANSGFHVEVERIMRTLWAPATQAHPHDTHWFYERARGQYVNAVAREGTPARQKIFKTANPPGQRFTKSELAKFEHSWAMLPHLVSLGAEKNFVLFSERLDQDPPAVDKDYCRRLVAKASLFRRTDRIVARRSFGGYKANIVAYTVALLVHATGARIDLDRIWREQDISAATHHAVDELCILVQKVLTSPPSGRTHVGEWTKKMDCWHAVRAVDWVVPPGLAAELLEPDSYHADLSLVRATDDRDWAELAAWGSHTGALDGAQTRLAGEVAEALGHGWDPSGRQLRSAVTLMRYARQQGFRQVPGF
jgi:hypothetical protein